MTNVGALVDLDTHAQATNTTRKFETSPDFKTQVQQFVEYEKKKSFIAQHLGSAEDEWTIFTVLFGLWDLLEYATLDKDAAMLAIENSIRELFHHLETLAIQVPASKVLIPLVVDMTFLPLFQSIKYKTDDKFAENQHLMVFLWTYWNSVLLQQATQWNSSDIYILDANYILMNQIRSKQLYSDGVVSVLDVEGPVPMFDNVVQPCLRVNEDDNMTNLHAAIIEKCDNPSAHLFW